MLKRNGLRYRPFNSYIKTLARSSLSAMFVKCSGDFRQNNSPPRFQRDPACIAASLFRNFRYLRYADRKYCTYLRYNSYMQGFPILRFVNRIHNVAAVRLSPPSYRFSSSVLQLEIDTDLLAFRCAISVIKTAIVNRCVRHLNTWDHLVCVIEK